MDQPRQNTDGHDPYQDMTPEQMREIQEGMRAELGSGRKDTLPLDNKAGYQGQLDLAALDRLKKAKDPRSVQYKIVKKNAEAHAAWKNLSFDDVDRSELQLDPMNSGQTHRAKLIVGQHTAQPYRASNFLPPQQTNGLGRGHRVHPPDHVVRAHMPTASTNDFGQSSIHRQPQGGRGNTNGNSAEVKPHVSGPKLSYTNTRSVNDIQFLNHEHRHQQPAATTARSPQAGATRPSRPVNSRPSFALVEPDQFMQNIWCKPNPQENRNDQVRAVESVPTPGSGVQGQPLHRSAAVQKSQPGSDGQILHGNGSATEQHGESSAGGEGSPDAVELLISFQDEPATMQPPQHYSSSIQDLLSLMDDEIVTQTLDEMDGNLSGSLSSRISSMVASNMAGKEESRATSSADGGAILGGLSTSRFAAATAVALKGRIQYDRDAMMKLKDRGYLADALPSDHPWLPGGGIRGEQPVKNDANAEATATLPYLDESSSEEKSITAEPSYANTTERQGASTAVGRAKDNVGGNILVLVEPSNGPPVIPSLTKSKGLSNSMFARSTGSKSFGSGQLPADLQPQRDGETALPGPWAKVMGSEGANLSGTVDGGSFRAAQHEEESGSGGHGNTPGSSPNDHDDGYAVPRKPQTEGAAKTEEPHSTMDNLDSRANAAVTRLALNNWPSNAPASLVEKLNATGEQCQSRHISAMSVESAVSCASFTTATESQEDQPHLVSKDVAPKAEDTASSNTQSEAIRPIERAGLDDGHNTVGKPLGGIAPDPSSGSKGSGAQPKVTPRGLSTSRFASGPPSAVDKGARPALSSMQTVRAPEGMEHSTGLMKKTFQSEKAGGAHEVKQAFTAETPSVRAVPSALVRTPTQSPVGLVEMQSGSSRTRSLRATAPEFASPSASKATKMEPVTLQSPLPTMDGPLVPVMATVMVPDGLGGYREVSGLLKTGSVPTVAWALSPGYAQTMGENIGPHVPRSSHVVQDPLADLGMADSTTYEMDSKNCTGSSVSANNMWHNFDQLPGVWR